MTFDQANYVSGGPWGLFWPGCCCGRGCWAVEDDFDRADNDDPGDDWDEISGDWDIKDNYLDCVSNGFLITTHRQPPPVGDGIGYNYQIIVDIVGMDRGVTMWTIILDWEDANNYAWVQLDFDSATSKLWPSFGRMDGGVNSTLMDKFSHPAGIPFHCTTAHTYRRIVICFSNTEWSVREIAGGNYRDWVLCGGGSDFLPDPPHGLVGFFNGDFDNWQLSEHYESNIDCPVCSCFCLNTGDGGDFSCLPEEILATFIPQTAYSCPTLDYATVSLYQRTLISAPSPGSPTFQASPHKYTWYSDKFTIGPISYWMIFNCVDRATGRYELRICEYPSTLGPCSPYMIAFPSQPGSSQCFQVADWTQSTCDPLKLVFPDLVAMTKTCNLPPPGGTGTCPSPCCTVCWATGEAYTVDWHVWLTDP